MSLHYILDGYNILHKLPLPAELNLEQQRDMLVRFLRQRRPYGSLNNEVTIVFDGRAEHYSPGLIQAGIRILFTDGESADEKIKKMVADTRSKGHIVVVTDDRGIRLSVRSDGAKVLGVAEFLAQRAVSAPDSPSKTMAEDIRHKINDELRRIWLGEE